MSEREPSFPCEPKRLLATLAQMQPSEGYVYVIMLLRIYEDGGACKDDIEAIANRCRYNKRVTADALDRLFKAGRLVRGPDGIHNPKADEVIESGRRLSEKRQEAGRKGAEAAHRKTVSNQHVDVGKAKDLPVADGNAPYLFLSSSESPEKEKKEREPRSRPRSTLPPDWKLPPEYRTYAMDHGFGHGQVERIATKFFNYHRAKGSKMADWLAAWRTWIGNQIEWGNQRPGGRPDEANRNGGGDAHKGGFASFAADRARAASQAGHERSAGAGRPSGQAEELGDLATVR